MFDVSEAQKSAIRKWLHESVYPAAIAHQKKAVPEQDPRRQIYESSWESGYPFSGAIGGGLTYEFTPTSLGEILVVRFEIGTFRQTLNFTEFGDW